MPSGVVVCFMTSAAERYEVEVVLVAESFVCAVVDVEPAGLVADGAAVLIPLKDDPTARAPLVRPEVLVVRRTAGWWWYSNPPSRSERWIASPVGVLCERQVAC